MLILSTLIFSLPLLTTTTNALPLDPPSLAPTNTNTTTSTSLFTNLPSPLEKRGHYGWLSSYAPTDHTCSGGWGGSRPKVGGECIKFKPISDNVGINWGTWPYTVHGLDAFSDENCKTKVGQTIDKPKNGMTCLSVKGQAFGKGWRSVKYHESY